MAARTEANRAQRLVVAALDFGTTYSGYAFAFHHDFAKEPPKVNANTAWVAGGELMSQKTPTTLLLDKDEKFVAFGYEAEDKWIQLAEDDEHRDYYYFRRFKMKLYDEQHLTRTTTLSDEQGKVMNAIKVFSICIKYLMDHCMKQLKNKVDTITANDVTWIMTVPAIWNDGAKQFMREAAHMAGIDKASLHIALEPEAASLWCMHQPLEYSQTAEMSAFTNGSRYMVIDAGGGTVDIIAHEVVTNGSVKRVKELIYADGNRFGGTSVDAAFEEFLCKLFGENVLEAFKKNHLEDWIELYRKFETKKRTVKTNATELDTLAMGATFIETYERETKRKITDAVSQNREFQGRINWLKGRLKFQHSIMKEMFKKACDNTVQQVGELLRQSGVSRIDTILLVGGFSGSHTLQDALRSNFPDLRLIVPLEAELAVVKGAVLFGHDPLKVMSRIAKISYGVRIFKDFQAGQHPPDKRQFVNGRMKCKDVFARHVHIGQTLIVDEPQVSQRYIPLEADQESLYFDIYSSKEKDPEFVTDPGTCYIGQLDVEIPGYGKDRGVLVNLIFGGTEVTVVARDEATQKVTKATLDFLFNKRDQ